VSAFAAFDSVLLALLSLDEDDELESELDDDPSPLLPEDPLPFPESVDDFFA